MTMTTDARDKQGYIGDLSKKTRTELLDLLSRQEKLLANRKFISRLPDKGKKIGDFKKQLEEILGKKKDDVSAVADELARLRVTSQVAGKCLDSDDDEDELNRNPSVWETLAANGLPTKTVTTSHQTDVDDTMPPLENDESEADPAPKESGFYRGLAHVMDKRFTEPVKKQRLKLNRPRHERNNVRQSRPQSSEDINKVEEESAVRYPIGPHAEAKILTITESMDLQKTHMLQMKELQVKQAVERLAQKMNIAIGEYEPEAENKMNYRQVKEVVDDTDDEGDSS